MGSWCSVVEAVIMINMLVIEWGTSECLVLWCSMVEEVAVYACERGGFYRPRHYQVCFSFLKGSYHFMRPRVVPGTKGRSVVTFF